MATTTVDWENVQLTPDALSDIDPPYPSRISPDVEPSRERLWHWITQEFNLSPKALEKFKAADFPGLMARGHPWARGADLDLLNRVVSWAFIFDDSFDKAVVGAEAAAGSIEQFRDVNYGSRPRTDEPRLVAIWRGLLSELDERSSEDTSRRCREHWQQTYESFQTEAQHRANGTFPTIHEYVRTRRYGSGAFHAFDWDEIVGGYEVAPHVRSDPRVCRMANDSNDVISWTNDLFSIRKDFDDGNSSANLVFVVANKNRIPLKDAVDVVRQMILAALDSFQRTEREFFNSECYQSLSPTEKRGIDRHITASKDWMKGNFDWHFLSRRYY